MTHSADVAQRLMRAHTLNRQWIGIDLTILALDPMRYRLEDRHGLKPLMDYEVRGYPTNMQEVLKLVRDEKRYHDFSNWAVTQLGLEPTRDTGDGGYDGVGHFTVWTPRGMEKTEARVLAEVKTGKPTLTQVRSFCHVMDRNQAKNRNLHHNRNQSQQVCVRWRRM